jgi:hypothetical protein
MTLRRLGWASTVLLGAVGTAQWWVGSPPVALLAASYVALVALLSRDLPVRVAVSAAFVVQQAVLLALELLVPVVAGGPLRPGVALGILLVPCLAVVPDVLLARRDPAVRAQRRERRDGPGLPWWAVPAASVGGVVLLVAAHGAVAWTASGDGRNHFLHTRRVLAEGGIHGDALSSFPVHQNALTALLMDTHGRGELAPGPLLEHDLAAMAQTSLVLAVAWTLAAPAALVALGPVRTRAALAALAVASVLPLAGVALGVLLKDGFVSILLLVPLLLSALSVLAWLGSGDRPGRGATLAVGVTSAAIPVVAMTWTPLALVLGCAAVAPWWRTLRSGEHRRTRLLLMAAGAGLGGAYAVHVATSAGGRLVDAGGSITAPSPWWCALVPVLVLVVAGGRATRARTSAFVPYLVGSLAAAAVTGAAVLAQDDGEYWNYYPAKFAWVWLLVGLPLLLAPFAHPRGTGPWWSGGALAGSLAVLLAAPLLSPLASPVRALDDWQQPTEASLALAAELGHPRTRYVVVTVDPIEDRLTNFWLVPYEGDQGPDPTNTFYAWGYTYSGPLSDVCDLLEVEPDRVVATADPGLEAQLTQECGAPVRVRVVSG